MEKNEDASIQSPLAKTTGTPEPAERRTERALAASLIALGILEYAAAGETRTWDQMEAFRVAAKRVRATIEELADPPTQVLYFLDGELERAAWGDDLYGPEDYAEARKQVLATFPGLDLDAALRPDLSGPIQGQTADLELMDDPEPTVPMMEWGGENMLHANLRLEGSRGGLMPQTVEVSFAPGEAPVEICRFRPDGSAEAGPRFDVPGAVFSFAAWLTTRDGVLQAGRGIEAAPMATLVEQWLDANDYQGPREDFHKHFRSPDTLKGPADTPVA